MSTQVVPREGEKVTINGLEWDVISVYTRAQAIDDGVLMDVSVQASCVGWKIPVAISCGICAMLSERAKQTPEKCLQRVTLELLLAARRAAMEKLDESRFMIQAKIAGELTRPFVVSVGPGDEGEAVLTIFFPEED